MSKANEPAFPIVANFKADADGLTKREYFAGLAMQGLVAYPGGTGNAHEIASYSVKCADALLAELEVSK